MHLGDIATIGNFNHLTSLQSIVLRNGILLQHAGKLQKRTEIQLRIPVLKFLLARFQQSDYTYCAKAITDSSETTYEHKYAYMVFRF